MRKVRHRARSTREDLVNDVKTVGTTVPKKNIANTKRRNGLKSCGARQVPALEKAHVQTRLQCANEHLSDSETPKGGGDDENRALCYQLDNKTSVLHICFSNESRFVGESNAYFPQTNANQG